MVQDYGAEGWVLHISGSQKNNQMNSFFCSLEIISKNSNALTVLRLRYCPRTLEASPAL